jgi:hypothetical protein
MIYGHAFRDDFVTHESIKFVKRSKMKNIIGAYFRKPMETINPANKYNCLICHYHTVKKSNYNQHILSVKHTNAENGNALKEIVVSTNTTQYKCDKCGHQYFSKSGLWKHSVKCNKKDNQLLLEIIKKSENMNNFLMEQNKKLMEIIQINKCRTI